MTENKKQSWGVARSQSDCSLEPLIENTSADTERMGFAVLGAKVVAAARPLCVSKRLDTPKHITFYLSRPFLPIFV